MGIPFTPAFFHLAEGNDGLVIVHLEDTNSPSPALGDIDPVVIIYGNIIRNDKITRFQAAVAKLIEKIEILIKNHDGTLQFINHEIISFAVPHDACNHIKLPRSASWPTEPCQLSIGR